MRQVPVGSLRVAMPARQDGRRPRLPNDRNLVRESLCAAEDWHELRRTAARNLTAVPALTCAESEKAARKGLGDQTKSESVDSNIDCLRSSSLVSRHYPIPRVGPDRIWSWLRCVGK